MQYDFALTPLGGQIINAKGRFFKYRAGVGLIRVKLTDGAVIDLLPGQGVSNRNFETIEITDKSGAINAGTILAGDFDFRDERITGTVDVVDGGKSRTLAKAAFFAYGAKNTTVGGNHPFIQLWNPPGSGKNIFVKSGLFSCSTASFIGLGPTNAAVGALLGNSKSKHSSGADGVLQVRGLEQVAFVNTFNLTGAYVAASQSVNLQLAEPILIEPGFGLVVGGSDTTNGTQITAAFELIEENI
jgi:hypothetical protein